MLIKVKVFPNSKEEECIEKAVDSFDIKVKAKPERGEANAAVLKILAEKFPNKRIRLISGAQWRNKVFDIEV